MSWESVSNSILTTEFCSTLRGITVVHCYIPKEISNKVQWDAFYEQSHAVQERLPKGDIVMVTGDLAAKMDSNNTLFGYTMGKHDLGDRSNNSKRFVDLHNFHRLVISGTPACYEVN